MSAAIQLDMNISRSLVCLAALALAAPFAAGCGASPESDASSTSEGKSEDQLLAGGQFGGMGLPTGTFALTFDDGPSDGTKQLAEFLAQRGVKATFFINGRNVGGRADALDAVLSNGHLLGNHTQNHLLLTSLDASTLLYEVQATDLDIAAAVTRNGVTQPWILRAPYGGWDASIATSLDGTAMRKYVGSIFWDVGGELTAHTAADWECWSKGVSEADCASLYLEEMATRTKGIVLMHDSHPETIDMFEKYVYPTMVSRHYTFAALTDVPSIRHAIGGPTDDGDAGSSGSGGTTADQSTCVSYTLRSASEPNGKVVAAGTCVQAASDGLWYRCSEAAWMPSSPSDAGCTAKFPLH